MTAVVREVVEGVQETVPTGIDVAIARIDDHMKTLTSQELISTLREVDFLLDLRNDLTRLRGDSS